VTGYIEESAVLCHGPSLGKTLRACASEVCVSWQSPRLCRCLEKCRCLWG